MSCLDAFVQALLILYYFSAEVCGGMSKGSQERITRHHMRKKKVTVVLGFCLAKIQEGTASFHITLELTVHMSLLLQIAPISI